VTASPNTSPDDVAAVRSILSPADPVPDPTLARDEVLAARAAVGMARAGRVPTPRPGRGRFVAAGAVAALCVATLVALVAVPSSQDEGTVDLATGPGAKAVSSAYAATAGAGTARGLLTVTHGGSALSATGVGSFDGGAAHFDIALADGAGVAPKQVTVIRTPEAAYARLPDGANPLAAGKPWVSVDGATLARLTQMALGDIGAQMTGAPLDALAYLKAVSGDVQVVGPDMVRGEPTTRYRGEVDPQKAAAQLPAALRPEADRAAGKVGQNLPADLWIDGEGRLRKLVLTADLAKVDGVPATVASGAAVVTVELWDFGTPVEVTAPPADQVVDVGGILGGFLGGAKRP
jgi:hypothetical protein